MAGGIEKRPTGCLDSNEQALAQRQMEKAISRCLQEYKQTDTFEGLYIIPPLSLGDMQNTPMSSECASSTFATFPPSTLPSVWSVPEAV